MSKEDFDYLFKFILIGNSGVGKSCLLHYFVNHKCKILTHLVKKNNNHTIGVEFSSKIVRIGNKTIKLHIWDTAGQERFRSVSKSYYRGAIGAIVVYDCTYTESFQALSRWIKDSKEIARPDILLLVLGNKNDLTNIKAIPTVEAAKFCQENNLSFLETSASTGENVEEAFILLAKNVLTKIECGMIDESEVQPKLMKKLRKEGEEIPKNSCSYCSYL